MDKKYFSDMKQAIKDFRKKMKDEGEQFFKDAVKDLFEQNPKLIKFSWCQYTPYFNDGDPCVFSANLDYPSMLLESGVVNKDGESFDDEDTWLDEEPWFTKEDKSEAFQIHKTLVEFLSQFDDDDMEMLFADHSRIIVSRETIEIEEYSHD